MDITGNCKILKIYLNEDARVEGQSLYHALVLKLKEIGMAGVTVTRGIEGYGHANRLHSTHILDLSLSLPIIVEVIDKPERIEHAARIVSQMVHEGLVMITDVNVVKYGDRELFQGK